MDAKQLWELLIVILGLLFGAILLVALLAAITGGSLK